MSTTRRLHLSALGVPLLVALALLLTAGHARAGGGAWVFDRPYYEPGDVVIATTIAQWGHNPSLGSPEDGPYGVWITPHRPLGPPPGSTLADWIESARYVTDVRIEASQDTDGNALGWARVRAEFTLPDVPPGLYSLLHCNYPCTTYLGDISGMSVFWVGPPHPLGQPTNGHVQPLPTTTTPPTTTRAPTTTTVADPAPIAPRPSRDLTVPVVAGGVVGSLAVGGSIAVVRRRRQGRDSSPT